MIEQTTTKKRHKSNYSCLLTHQTAVLERTSYEVTAEWQEDQRLPVSSRTWHFTDLAKARTHALAKANVFGPQSVWLVRVIETSLPLQEDK